MWIGLLIKCAKPLSLLVLVAGLAGYRALLIHQRDSARVQVTELEAQRVELGRANAALQQAVAAQNQAVDDLNTAAAKQAKAAQERQQSAVASGAVELQGQSARAAAIAQALVPGGCDGAMAWGNAQGPELGRW